MALIELERFIDTHAPPPSVQPSHYAPPSPSRSYIAVDTLRAIIRESHERGTPGAEACADLARDSIALAALRAIVKEGLEGCPTAKRHAELAREALTAMGYE